MTWVDLAVATAVAGALLVLPGLVAAAAVGLRGLWLAAASIPLSVTVLAVSAYVAPVVGLSWAVSTIVAGSIALAIAATVCRLALRRWWTFEEPTSRRDLWSFAAAVLGGLILAVRLVGALGKPDGISQTYDSNFHLNAVRWILESANASPAHVSALTFDPPGFYPSGFHGLAAMVCDIAGVAPPVGLNATWLALSVIAWPLGIIALTRALGVSSRAAIVGAGVLAAAFPAFPYLLVEYGVLYPLMAAYSVLPAVLAVSVRALRLTDSDRGRDALTATEPSRWPRVCLPWLLLTVAMLPGLALTHPTGLVSWMVLVTPWVVIAVARHVRGSTWLARVVWGLAALAWVCAVVVAMQVLRPAPDARFWPPLGTMAQAMGEVLFLAVYGGSIPIVLVALTAVGALCVGFSRSRGWWNRMSLVSGAAVFVVLYVVVAGVGSTWVRDTVTGSWYNNTPRVAALLPVVVVPIAALGVEAIWLRVRSSRIGRRGQDSRSSLVRTLVPVAAVIVLTVVVQGRALSSATENMSAAYATTDDSPLLSSDEKALLERLDESVPEGSTVAGNPWTGTALAYAIANRPVLYPHILRSVTPDIETVTQHLREAERGDDICGAAERLDVEYVLDFGQREILDQGPHRYPGLESLATSGAFDLIDREGNARLYRLTACG